MGISRIQYAYERGRILKGIELLVQNKFSYKIKITWFHDNETMLFFIILHYIVV